jgi:hypothetical protein
LQVNECGDHSICDRVTDFLGRFGLGSHSPAECSIGDVVTDTLAESIYQYFMNKNGGEREIRTPGRIAPSLVFETSAFNHSATSPTVEEHTDILRIWKTEDGGFELRVGRLSFSSGYQILSCIYIV